MGILSAQQKRFLALFGESKIAKEFYLTGGTALAEFYLQHRYSEDLDFFSEIEIDPLSIDAFLKSIQSDLGFIKVDSQQSFNRNLYFLHFPNKEILKTEFTFFPFAPIEKGAVKNGVHIDSLLDIAVNKLFTIYQRTKARDYIDLYMLCREKGFTIADLIKNAKIKFDWHIDPLQLGTQFLKATTAEDYPRLLIELKPQEWQNWFQGQAKLFQGDILTK